MIQSHVVRGTDTDGRTRVFRPLEINASIYEQRLESKRRPLCKYTTCVVVGVSLGFITGY